MEKKSLEPEDRKVNITGAENWVRFDEREMEQLKEVLTNNDLFYFPGKKTPEFCEKAKTYFGSNYCVPCSSGTGGLHAAVASLEIEPGYEVITSPITDMGTLIGILYQNLIPVFADLDPHTYNVTADSIRKKITDRTRAVIAVHLAGNPCEMDEITALAAEHGIPVIEDVAQSYNAVHRGKKAGTIGDIGCFSLNGFKHISCGDGGFILSDSEERYYKLCNYIDKFYDRHRQGVRLSALAPCYRMTELQSAVAVAQLEKLDRITETRKRYGDMLTRLTEDIPCLTPHKVHPHNSSSYWFYMFRVIPGKLKVSRDEFAAELTERGLSARAGYIPQPIYMEKLFTEKNFFPGGIWPAEIIAERKYEYGPGICPVAEDILDTAILLPIKEYFTEDDIKAFGRVIRESAEKFSE